MRMLESDCNPIGPYHRLFSSFVTGSAFYFRVSSSRGFLLQDPSLRSKFQQGIVPAMEKGLFYGKS